MDPESFDSKQERKQNVNVCVNTEHGRGVDSKGEALQRLGGWWWCWWCWWCWWWLFSYGMLCVNRCSGSECRCVCGCDVVNVWVLQYFGG